MHTGACWENCERHLSVNRCRRNISCHEVGSHFQHFFLFFMTFCRNHETLNYIRENVVSPSGTLKKKAAFKNSTDYLIFSFSRSDKIKPPKVVFVVERKSDVDVGIDIRVLTDIFLVRMVDFLTVVHKERDPVCLSAPTVCFSISFLEPLGCCTGGGAVWNLRTFEVNEAAVPQRSCDHISPV